MYISCTRFADTSFSAISRNLILLSSSMNDANEKDAEGETLRAATNRLFRMQCFTHTRTHLHSNLSINSFVTNLKRNAAVVVATSRSVFRYLF